MDSSASSAEGQGSAPQAASALWPDPFSGPFRVRVWFGRVDGRPAVVGVEMWGVQPVEAPWIAASDLRPPPPGSPLGTTTLPDTEILAEDIRLPLGRLRDWWVEHQRARARAARAEAARLSDVRPGHEQAVRKFEQRLEGRRVGRPPLSEAFLRRVTEIYNEAVSEGDRAPNLRVKEALGATTEDTARSWVKQARKRGLPVLPPPRRTRERPMARSWTTEEEQ